MSVREITFNPAKALEAVVYIASKQQAAKLESDLHSISKLMYWADMWHLQHYGDTTCGDRYIAMKYGPVPSGIYDMIRFVRGDGKYDFPSATKKGFAVVNKYVIQALREPNLSKLSESEIAAIGHAISTYGKMSFKDRTQESHDEAWQAADPNGEIPLKAVIGLLPNSDHILSYQDSE